MTAWLCGIFFLSGVSALVFETLWFHQAGLVFGNGVWASSLVLAAFMAGLALGNGLVARRGDRIRRPVRFYAGLEATIATSGVAIVLGLPLLVPMLVPVLRPLIDLQGPAGAVRLVVGFAVMVVPSTAMGATLPVLVKALLAHDPSFGSALGRLYGFNTLGAVVGAVLAEAVLLGRIGVRGSAFFAGSLSLLVAALAVALSDRFASAASSEPAPAAHDEGSSPLARRLLGAAFLSGFCLLALEVVWFRFLLLFIHGSSLIFSILLAVVLAGIALGSLAAGVLMRRARADRLAPLLSALSGVAVVALYAAFSLVPPSKVYLTAWGPAVLRASLLMGLPSLLSGAVFTCIGAALGREIGPPTRAAGEMTLWNTLGSGLGSLAAGFVLLPLLGIERSFFALALCYGIVALLALPAARGAEGRLPRAWPAPALLLVAALVAFPFGKMQGVFLDRAAGPYERATGAKRVLVVEGRSETVMLLERKFLGVPVDYVLMTNGHAMSTSNSTSRRYMKLYVYLPVAFEPKPKKALLISYGVGNTARALVQTKSLKRIDVVDISREILGTSSRMHPGPGQDPLQDPRVHVHVEDGRYFLQTTDQHYDLITGEPPPPKNAGVVNLYTREYFQLTRDRLTEGGIHTYWLPIHNLTLSDARAIVAAYCDVFPDCSLWTGTAMDWMLVGSRNRHWGADEATLASQWRDPQVRASMAEVGFEHPEQLASTFMADADQLRAFVAGAKPLVDDFPKRLSNHVPMPIEGWPEFAPWVDAKASEERFEKSRFLAQALPEAFRRRTLGYFEAQRIVDQQTGLAAAGARDLGQRIADLNEMLDGTDLVTIPLWELGGDVRRLHIAETAPPREHDRTPAIYQRALGALAHRDADEAARLLQVVGARSPGDLRALRFRAYALCRAGRVAEADSLVARATRLIRASSADAPYWAWMHATFGVTDPFAGPVASR